MTEPIYKNQSLERMVVDENRWLKKYSKVKLRRGPGVGNQTEKTPTSARIMALIR